MAKRPEVKKVTVKVNRPFMAAGVVIPKTQGEGKTLADVRVELPVNFARELIANGKAELTTEKKNFDMPKEEKSFEDELSEL